GALPVVVEEHEDATARSMCVAERRVECESPPYGGARERDRIVPGGGLLNRQGRGLARHQLPCARERRIPSDRLLQQIDRVARTGDRALVAARERLEV